MAREPGNEVGRRARLHEVIDSESEALFVGEGAGAVAGFGRVQWLTPRPGAPANAVPEGWYLTGVMVDPVWRRRGLGDALTVARLNWVWRRSDEVWYFANVRNQASIDLHSKFGFVEVTKEFSVPGLTFDHGEGMGVLFCCTQPSASHA